MNNTYGTKKPANITSSDVDIFYSYRPTRGSEVNEFSNFKQLDSSYLVNVKSENNSGNINVLPGMFDLRLPLDKFSKAGIYTIYIKPKEVYTQIVDVSTLLNFPDIRGIVLSSNGNTPTSNGSLNGYRIEYFEGDNRTEDFRLITSSNKCEPVAQNLNDGVRKAVRYRFNENSNLIFCTVTPSTASSFKPTTVPNLGVVGQQIALINTKFNPIMLEIEMVEHDAETISNMLEGDQIRDLDNATITTYNKDKEIYHHAEYYSLKNKLGEPLYEVKVKKDVGNNEMEYNNIVK